jgi:mono/diheme cytochrome c family protein
MSRIHRVTGVALILAGTLMTIGAARQQRPGWPPKLLIASMDGRDLSEFYCAGCHGRDARGGSHVPLAIVPPDLTYLSVRNGGVWPGVRIRTFVAGDEPRAAHRRGGMPAWGAIFRGLDPDARSSQARIANIADYLATLQVKYAAP